jgi:hypothetical protein
MASPLENLSTRINILRPEPQPELLEEMTMGEIGRPGRNPRQGMTAQAARTKPRKPPGAAVAHAPKGRPPKPDRRK